ncbi:uncharacterized protein TNCV_491041 [Trichonephila clavipes]|nr:uncharacterized protein TNCV_491041 [Trichonephila clavipes]
MRCFPGVPSCEKCRIQVSSVPACGINGHLFACVYECRFSKVPSVRVPECSCVVLYKSEVNKSVENATSCDFENENCDPPSEVRGIGIEKNNRFKIEKGKEINVYRNSDSEGRVFVGSVKAVAMCAQRVINLDDIGVASLELIGDKKVANPEGLIWESNCEEKDTIVALTGGEKQLTVDREGFRNHTMVKIAGQLNA